MKGKYLITTDNWFIAPDGKSYRAVWGEVHTMTAAEALGIEPNRNSANWMVKVGTEEHHIILAGCQIHYAVSCPDRPNQGDTLQKYSDDKEKNWRDNVIYIPEPKRVREPLRMVDGETIVDKVATAKTFEFLDQLRILDMDSEDHRNFLGEKATTLGVKFYQTIREPYQRTYNILEVMWGNETETREILRDPKDFPCQK